MPFAFQDSLAKLQRLSPETLHQTACRLRAELGAAEWKLSICLLAASRSSSFRSLGYSTISDYSERGLQLTGKRTYTLLGIARALEHLPLLSEAFQAGQIPWAKLRAIQNLATPQTETQWLDFAMSHRSDEVVRKIAMSPDRWKRLRALQAASDHPGGHSEDSVELNSNQPTVDDSARSAVDFPAAPTPSALFGDPQPKPMDLSAARSPSGWSPSDKAQGSWSSPPAPSFAPRIPAVIRLVIELTPDQYALYERAEHRVRAQERKRIPRATVLTRMAETILDAGSARSRAKHQVLVHTVEGSEEAWYDTDRGLLPVDPKVLQSAGHSAAAKPSPSQGATSDENDSTGPSASIANSESSNAASEDSAKTAESGTAGAAENLESKRSAIPSSVLRQLSQRANHRCERCGQRGCLLDAHHKRPVSEGGDNALDSLELICKACHSLHHEGDFASKRHWRDARDAQQRKSNV